VRHGNQYCGALGQVANCQSVVSWHFTGEEIGFPLVGELYLPKEWTNDSGRLTRVGVPSERRRFVEKWRLAFSSRSYPGECSLRSDHLRCGLRGDLGFFTALDERRELFIGQIPESHGFWPNNIEMITTSRSNRGRRKKYATVADMRHKPYSAKRWREKLQNEGVAFETVELPLHQRRTVEVAAVRVRQANAKAYYRPGPERWLLIERIGADIYKYYVSNFPKDTTASRMVILAHRRRRIEQGYQKLKEELGLDHCEGRSWGGASSPCRTVLPGLLFF
jgi:SRSO17 transposase